MKKAGKEKREKGKVLRVHTRNPGVACRTFLFSLFSFLAFSGCKDAFTTDVNVVAQAGSSSLTVDRLAEIVAQGKALALRREVIERVSRLWVDYSLFAERTMAGDSLLDSATVLATLWPEVQQRMADHFHEVLLAQQVSFDSAHIDSVFAAGGYRLIQHILIRIEPTIAPPAKDARRKRADALHARLVGGGSWTEANRSNEDPASKASGGTLGVFSRAEMNEQLADAAWSLEPGEVSGVVETSQGFHILRRPRLLEQRTAFVSGLEDKMVERMDSIYLASLGERRHVRVKSQAAPAVRAALADPVTAGSSRTVLGTFDGGRFTVADLIRWINAMPPQVQQQVSRADDAQIEQFIRSLMRNQALMVEAESAGMKLTALDIEEFRSMLRNDLAKVRTAMGLDDGSLAEGTSSKEDRQRLAALYVDKFLEGIANNKTNFVSVPPFLAARLREQSSWRVTSAGVERVLQRATELRASLDSLRPAPKDSGGSNVTR